MKLSRLHQVALAVGLALPGACVFAAPVEANLILGYLNYSLTSLDGAGGATPSLTPSSSSTVYVYVTPDVGNYADSGYLQGSGDHFDGSYVDVYEPSNLSGAVKSGNSQIVFSELTANELLDNAKRDVYGQVKIYADYTLSAHTRMDIEGPLSMSTRIDSAAISSVYANSASTWTLTASASFRSHISTEAGVVLQTNAMSSYTDPTFGSTAQYWYWNAGATQSFAASGVSDLSAFYDPPKDNIHMQIVNNGDSEVRFSLNSMAYTHAIISAVPEPGTWALMSLGLIGIAAAARRRSA